MVVADGSAVVQPLVCPRAAVQWHHRARLIRTLKEQCLWLHRFDSLEEAREIIGTFIGRYNHHWLIERLDHRTPAVARRELLAAA